MNKKSVRDLPELTGFGGVERIDVKYILTSIRGGAETCGLEWRWELSSSWEDEGMRLSLVREKQEGEGTRR